MKQKYIRVGLYFTAYFLILSLSSCTALCKIPSIKTVVDSKTISFAESEIPCKKEEDFRKAVELTIRSIYSAEFERQLTNYVRDSLGTGPHVQSWLDVEAKTIVMKMRDQLEGTSAETYGGLKGLWLNLFFGNVAYDGIENGPILLNRIPLKHRSPSDIANTIAHEVAHRIGLAHPHSDKDFEIAKLEPPYVIGNMIEKIARTLE